MTELGFVGEEEKDNVVKIIEEVEEENNDENPVNDLSSHKDFDFEKSRE